MSGLRTVLIGAGKIGIGKAASASMRFASHASVLSVHPAFRWDAVVDPSAEARRSVVECWGVRIAAASLAELRREYRPEVAVIATPPEGRLEILRQLPGVRGVLVEKPLGLTYAEAHALVEYCDAGGVPLQVNFLRRADRRLRALAEGELEEWIGTPECAFGVYGRGLRNNGVHMVDQVRMLLGEVASAEPLGPAEPAPCAPIAGDVHVPFLLRMVSGVRVTMHPLSFEQYRENGLDIWGKRGRLSIVEEGRRIVAYRPGPHPTLEGTQELIAAQPQSLDTGLGEAFYAMYDNLAAAITEGAHLWSSGRSALATERIVEAVSHGSDIG